MTNLHPEQYYPIAFFIITALNIVGAFVLISSKRIRLTRKQQSKKRIDRIVQQCNSHNDRFGEQIASDLAALDAKSLYNVALQLHSNDQTAANIFKNALISANVLHERAGRLKRASKWDQISLLKAFGVFRFEPALPQLIESLESADPDIVYAAISALSSWNTKETAGYLLRLLRKDNPVNPSRVAAAIGAMSVNIEELLREKAGSPDMTEQYWIAILLGRFNTPTSRATLAQLVLSPHPHVRAGVLKSLAKAGSVETDHLIIERLKDVEWYVRAQAARACGTRRIVASISRLVQLFFDKQWWVREDAREAIELIGASAVPSLLPLLQSEDRFARNCAADALTRMGFVDATIWDLTKDTATREHALSILVNIRKAEGAPDMEDKIEKLDPVVYQAFKTRIENEMQMQ